MPETFVILDDGETLITGTWDPSPEDTSARMLALANSYDNMFIPLADSREAAIQSTHAHFDSESDPSGVKWPTLIDKYLKSKVASGYPSDEILVRTGEGKAAATSEAAWIIADDELWFDETALPSYMFLHQMGTEHLGLARERTGDKILSGESVTRQELADLNKSGRGKYLPQRQFVGFDEVDQIAIVDIWDKWFISQVEEIFPIEETHGGYTMGSNMLGNFPVVGYTKRGQPMLRTPQGIRFGRK